jgi:hypothetical protein
MSSVQYIICTKDSEGSMLVRPYASTVYSLGKVKSKSKQMLLNVIPKKSNLTQPKLIQTLQNATSDKVVYRKIWSN